MRKVKQIKRKGPVSKIGSAKSGTRNTGVVGKEPSLRTNGRGGASAGKPRSTGGTGGPGGTKAVVIPPGKSSGSKGRRGGTRSVQRTMKVRELVPQQVCGPRTRVERVFRVEERVNNSSQTHLVFNDHHGWYCEHGTDCHAVDEVRKAR